MAGLEPAVDVRVAYVDVPEYPRNKVIAMHFDGWGMGASVHIHSTVAPITKLRAPRK